MDTHSEDTIVRQIEKNLSNNINEKLFLPGKTYESTKIPARSTSVFEKIEDAEVVETKEQELPLVSNENLNYSPSISRAEYIRQAREACLRQLSSLQVYNRPYESNYLLQEEQSPEQVTNKKAKLTSLFHNEIEDENEDKNEDKDKEEESQKELASYRSLIIRGVCAIVLFIGVFIIDKFQFKIGNLTHSMIQEYVTGKDTLQVLEDILVTWLK